MASLHFVIAFCWSVYPFHFVLRSSILIHVMVIQGQQISTDELHSLSDAWEFQETEIVSAQDKLRSTRARMAALEGKMALEIMYLMLSA